MAKAAPAWGIPSAPQAAAHCVSAALAVPPRLDRANCADGRLRSMPSTSSRTMTRISTTAHSSTVGPSWRGCQGRHPAQRAHRRGRFHRLRARLSAWRRGHRLQAGDGTYVPVRAGRGSRSAIPRASPWNESVARSGTGDYRSCPAALAQLKLLASLADNFFGGPAPKHESNQRQPIAKRL
jgi:hypothetical protein